MWVLLGAAEQQSTGQAPAGTELPRSVGDKVLRSRQSSFKGLISPSGTLFPPGFGGLMCQAGHNCPFLSLLRRCTCMMWPGKVPGNFGVSPGKIWSREGSFTCQHSSWKPPGLPFLLLLLVSRGIWFKRSLNVNHVKFLCSYK